ncbi:venom metalloproteinase antarease-like TtrivMP_A [Rhipicephalus sanguineus]|uniref:venom metalloproteinase antarease-like TtrivMP_A n=1 Tax=Rhipicephalus sanguineus TaxID=34632 RepID=UPI001894CCD9|nr:venom metalloproteinase antarease-like TtrivMP_A [Rhipicephalus sanguineus]
MHNTEQKMLLIIYLLQVVILSCYAAPKAYNVYPLILEERNTAGNLVLQLSDKITLNLEKSSVIADNLIFVTSTKDLNDVETVDTSHIRQNIYHDTHYQSSLMVRQKDGNVEVEGIINDNLRIKPLPERERSLQGQMLHKIFEVDPIKGNFIKAEPEILRLRERQNNKNSNGSHKGSHSPQSRAASVDKFPVELHIISDRAHQQYYKKNQELITYLAIMANAVNLRYLDMENPKISFLLVGVTRAKDHDFAKNNYGEIEAGEMLSGLQAYTNQGRVPGKYDVAFLITGLDIIKFVNGRKDKNINGRAYIGAACSRSGIGEGEDVPHTYDGVNMLAHELAHSLGSPHDETPECPWSDGYLMSYVDGGLRKYRLSRCSQKKIRQYVRKQTEECIKVVNEQNYMKNQKKLPGQTVRKLYYCKQLLKKKAQGREIALGKSDGCHISCCCHNIGYMTCYKYARLDGMACGQGKTCKRGVCDNHKWLN